MSAVTIRFGQRVSVQSIPLDTRIRAAVRRCLAEEIERLIAVVDSLDVDADMEPGGEEEPYLGWIGNGPGRNDTADDREADAGDEGEMPEDDEPSLGWTVDGQHGDMRDLEGEVQLP